MRSIEEIIAAGGELTEASLIPLLQAVQREHGYVSPEAIAGIARAIGVPRSTVYGVATFYNQFRFQAQGRFHIQVCRGTACHVKGSARVLSAVERELGIKPGSTTRDKMFSLEVVACIGACGLAPVICINGEFHASVTTQKISKILDTYRRKAADNGNR